ncbi:hypothetical protein D9757_007769 [Collybiopsis confluens]|uniref:Uncharacterized protein n=1 Tax=Collybiopsis confluens TaxID=2823264 RepID=A0A8H5MB51_9AGAR|nr:hypothetical protein D9757_007769 [Collybiopsis confluens]
MSTTKTGSPLPKKLKAAGKDASEKLKSLTNALSRNKTRSQIRSQTLTRSSPTSLAESSSSDSIQTIGDSSTPSTPHFTPLASRQSHLSAETPRVSRGPSHSSLNPTTQSGIFPAHLPWKKCQRITMDGIWADIPRWDIYNPDRNMPDYRKPGWAHGVQSLAARFHQGDLNDELLSVHRRRDIEAKPFSSPRSASGATEYSVALELVGTTQKTSKKHLEGWILHERGTLDCDVTGCWPCEAAHVIEKRYSLKARIAIYYALGGWISPNSRLNFFYMRGDMHKRLDLHTLFIYLTDEEIIKSSDDYITHVNDEQTALGGGKMAVDILSLLRTQHPLLCDGTAFKYAIANKKNTRGDFCYKKAHPDSNINGLEFESYAHPLVVLVRMCAMFDELVRRDNKSSWAERVVYDYFDIDQQDESLCRIINRNMALLSRLRRMIPSDLEWFKKKRREVQSVGDVFTESNIQPPGGAGGRGNWSKKSDGDGGGTGERRRGVGSRARSEPGGLGSAAGDPNQDRDEYRTGSWHNNEYSSSSLSFLSEDLDEGRSSTPDSTEGDEESFDRFKQWYVEPKVVPWIRGVEEDKKTRRLPFPFRLLFSRRRQC